MALPSFYGVIPWCMKLLFINHLEFAHEDFDICSIYSIGKNGNDPLYAGQNSSNGFLTEFRNPLEIRMSASKSLLTPP